MNKKIVIILVVVVFVAVAVYLIVFQNKPNSQPAQNGNTQLANPASVNCVEKGGTVQMKTRGDGGQYGLCYFEDNRACEEWALMRGDCPVGGVKTTGFDTEAQSYCAWLGGQTLAATDAVCTFNDGSTCLAALLFNGQCNKGENFQGK